MGFIIRLLLWIAIVYVVLAFVTGKSREDLRDNTVIIWNQLVEHGIRGTAETIWCGKSGCEHSPPSPIKKSAP